MGMSALIGALRVTLGLDSAAFEKGSKKAQNEVATLRGSITKAGQAISSALTGMVAWEAVQQLRDMTRAAIDSAGGLGEQAAALGVSTTALQEYRYAATQVGLEAAEMDTAFAQLTRRMGDAALAGKGPIVDAFNALGISLDELKGKSAGDVIPMIADGLERIEDPAVRASIAVDLFGKSGQKLATLLAGGADEVNKLREAAHEMGIVLSEEDIAKADEVADKLAALNFVIEAQSNKKLLENAEALLEFEQAIGDLKLQLIEFSGDAERVNDFFATFDGQWQTFWRSIGEAQNVSISEIGQWFVELANTVSESVSGMVQGIKHWFGDTLGAIWDKGMAKIRATGALFAWLYDVVVGHSYIPDMVDEIGAHMARLDTLMVGQAGRATSATGKKFQDLRDLIDDLFPEAGKANQYNADLAALEGAGMSPEALAEASLRLWRKYTSGSPFGGGGMGEPDLGDGRLTDGMGDVGEAIEKLTEKAKVSRVRIADSFKDMADDTLAAINRMTSAIKGGGFLDILSSVMGFAMQLGSVGAFGKTIAGRINAVPAYAGGTNFHPGGLAVVGEEGPEVLELPRGSRVTPNGAFGGATVTIVPSRYFDAVVDGRAASVAAPMAALASTNGSIGAQTAMARRGSRRFP